MGSERVDEHNRGHVERDTLIEAIMELVGGAYVTTDSDGVNGFSYKLVQPVKQPQADDFAVLIHRGWLESHGANYRLTDAGRKAYLKWCDELGDGMLLHPHEWKN